MSAKIILSSTYYVFSLDLSELSSTQVLLLQIANILVLLRPSYCRVLTTIGCVNIRGSLQAGMQQVLFSFAGHVLQFDIKILFEKNSHDFVGGKYGETACCD